jgi:hypothetical protein
MTSTPGRNICSLKIKHPSIFTGQRLQELLNSVMYQVTQVIYIVNCQLIRFYGIQITGIQAGKALL